MCQSGGPQVGGYGDFNSFSQSNPNFQPKSMPQTGGPYAQNSGFVPPAGLGGTQINFQKPLTIPGPVGAMPSQPFTGGARPMQAPQNDFQARLARNQQMTAQRQTDPNMRMIGTPSNAPMAKSGFGGQNPDFSPLPPDGQQMPPAGPAYLYGTTAGMFGAPQSPDPRMMYNLGQKSWGLIPGYNGVQ